LIEGKGNIMMQSSKETEPREPEVEHSGSKRSQREPSDEGGDTKRASLSLRDEGSDGSLAEDAEDDTRKLEEKRAYNRRNAARARQRVKDQLTDLSEKVENFSHLNEKLKQASEQLRDQVKMLTEENHNLKLYIASNGQEVGGTGAPDRLKLMQQQGSNAQNSFPSLAHQREPDVGQSHGGWNPGVGLSSQGLEQKDSGALASQLMFAQQQQQFQQQQQHHQEQRDSGSLASQLLHAQQQQQQLQQGPNQGSDAALNIQRILAREVERQLGHTSSTPQEASFSVLTAITSQMLSSRDQQQPPSISMPGANAQSAQQGGDEADRQRAIILALLSQNQQNQYGRSEMS
jgi:hypothetical protein